MDRDTLPYGCWPSPITAALAAGKSRRFGMLQADGGSLYWSESRPEEGGRGVIMAADAAGALHEVLPPPWSARSRVHEYGGGEFLIQDGTLWFVEADGQDIHVLEAGSGPRRLTAAPDHRFADMALDAPRRRLICVAERHDSEGAHAYPENFLASVPLGTAHPVTEITALVEGQDFYASPRLSPDGQTLAWIAWDLPHMPWEAAALYAAPIGGDGSLGEPVKVAGGDGSAVFQPGWLGDGRLAFVWDRSGWGNLYVWDGASIECLDERNADLLRPQWAFGMQSWMPFNAPGMAAVYLDADRLDLRLLHQSGGAERVPTGAVRGIEALAPFAGGIAVIGASDTLAPSVLALPSNGTDLRVLRAGAEAEFNAGDVSIAQHLLVEAEGSEPVHALYYPPANAACSAPGDEAPPVIVTAHGGPTGRADRGLKIKTQFWTSRGFGVCDVDYSGSSGYGRAYRERLDGQWGLRDVADVLAVADHLAAKGLADPDRLLISGGSAGGFTVLLALARHDRFAAGACSYGVSDLAQLQRITHKFEGGYLYGLTGTTPENCEDEFTARSPLNLAADIASPVIFFQGSDDFVVPPEQTRSMAQTLREGGVPVACYEFEGEGHGFRRGETIEAVLGLEYAFYAAVLDLEPAETLPAVEIANWHN